uniref:GIY-YIG domain-containing protein n=1 Tax=viral metagenome TaxID=1070528 RepID=A0A6M3KKH2_9ZZZZ
MKGYIYLTTCLVNDKKYIGQSVNHRDINTYLGSGIAFKCALRKYGKDNFEKTILVDNVSCLSELNKLERDFIQKYDCIVPNGYNLDLGGTNKGRMSEVTKTKIIKSKKGKKHTLKQIEANIKSHKGLKLTNETKRKISKSMKGKPSWNKGKKMPAGHSEKMRQIMTGKKMKKKQIEIFDKETSLNVFCNGVADAADKLNVSISSISLLTSGKISHIKHRYYLVGALTLEAHPISYAVGG